MKRGASIFLLFIFVILFVNVVSAVDVYIGNKTLTEGEVWTFEGVYSVSPTSINIVTKQATIALSENGMIIHTDTVNQGYLYKYHDVVYCNISRVYSVVGNELVTFTDCFLDNVQVCEENWTCWNWNSCQNGWQWRACVDRNDCGTETSKPVTNQSCVDCVSNYECTDWSECENSEQTRTCTDMNHCGFGVPPAVSQDCQVNPPAANNNPPANNPGGGNPAGANPNNVYNFYYNNSDPNIPFNESWFSEGRDPSLDFLMLFGPIFSIFFTWVIILLFIVMLVLIVGVYIYTSLAYSKIARRLELEHPRIAWIPGVGPAIIASKAAGMHWWPVLLLIGFWIPFLNVVLILTFVVFWYIWMWKTFSALGRPGWWVLLGLIPVAGGIIFLIILGVAAWGNQEKVKKKRRQ